NDLVLIRWVRDPETRGRFAVVRVPRLEAKLIDAERGLYSITLQPTDAAGLAAWAADSGVRIIQHDAVTGETVVQPLDWQPPKPRPVTVPAHAASAAPVATHSAVPSASVRPASPSPSAAP